MGTSVLVTGAGGFIGHHLVSFKDGIAEICWRIAGQVAREETGTAGGDEG